MRRDPRYNTRNRPNIFVGTVTGTCSCGHCFAECYDCNPEMVALQDEQGQYIIMECPQCGKLVRGVPRIQ